MSAQTNLSVTTMSSREIAELCEKRHSDVCRDIRNMLEEIGLAERKFASGYFDVNNQKRTEYQLPKDLTLTLITGYRADLRYKVIKRLELLEAWLIQEAIPEPLPANADDVVFGVKVSVLNAAARTAAVIERIYGPEAARALWELDKKLPQVAQNSVTFAPDTEDFDPENCLVHLLNAKSGDGRIMVELLVAGMVNLAEAKQLKDYGIVINPPEALNHVAVFNQNRFLSSVYADTHWCLNWQASLVQLKGAFPSIGRGFSGKNRAVLVPFATIETVMGGNNV